MRKLILIILFLLTSLHSQEAFKIKYNKIEAKKIELSTEHFTDLLDWSLSLRQRTIYFFKEYKLQKEKNKPLTGQQILSLQYGIKEHYKLRQELYLLLDSFRPFLESENLGLVNEANKLKIQMLAYSIAITLYDNYEICLSGLASESELRRLVDKENPSLAIAEKSLTRIMKSYHSSPQRRKMRALKEEIVGHKIYLDELASEDTQLAFLQELIEQSPADKVINDSNTLFDYGSYFKVIKRKSFDSFSKVGSKSSHGFSKIFGNTMGLVQTRHGKLYQKFKAEQEIRKQLKPLDILLEKTPFRLTDKIIPGYYGHVAIWLGTEAELKALELWDHPMVKPHQEAIREGKSVLEALRHGVVLNDLAQFMDIDDFASLRHKDLKPSASKETLLRCFQQIGKEYDFNFDVETLDKIVCSEIVYHTFIDLNWPTEKTLGRSTISPDNVANKALKQEKLKPVILYIDGQACQHKIQDRFTQLLEED